MKRQLMGWEKIFENHIKGFTPQIYKELIKLFKKKNYLKNEQRN